MADNDTTNPKIVATETRPERLTLPPREFERMAPKQGDEGRRQETQSPEKAEKENPDMSQYVSRAEVQAVLNDLVQSIAAEMVSKSELTGIWAAINSIAANSNMNFVTRQQAEQIAKDAVPMTIRDIDSSASKRTGNTLMLSVGGASGRDSVYFGTPKTASAASGGIDFSKVALGYTASGTSVTILAGKIDGHDVTQTVVTVADQYYVYVRRTLSNDTMLVVAAVSVPTDDATYKYYRLYQFYVTGTTVILKTAFRPFDIEGFMPNGSAANLHLKWDVDSNKWVVGMIVPNGEEDDDNLVWNDSLQVWEADRIMPSGDADHQHLVWVAETEDTGYWNPDMIIPRAGEQYQVLQKSNDTDAYGDKVPIFDWVRWHA